MFYLKSKSRRLTYAKSKTSYVSNSKHSLNASYFHWEVRGLKQGILSKFSSKTVGEYNKQKINHSLLLTVFSNKLYTYQKYGHPSQANVVKRNGTIERVELSWGALCVILVPIDAFRGVDRWMLHAVDDEEEER